MGAVPDCVWRSWAPRGAPWILSPAVLGCACRTWAPRGAPWALCLAMPCAPGPRAFPGCGAWLCLALRRWTPKT